MHENQNHGPGYTVSKYRRAGNLEKQLFQRVAKFWTGIIIALRYLSKIDV